ncbi:15490_t:CDS:2 [Funneliformis geosporum]|nr:15490_t:CDS:2 [Funneliformis geosporum]
MPYIKPSNDNSLMYDNHATSLKILDALAQTIENKIWVIKVQYLKLLQLESADAQIIYNAIIALFDKNAIKNLRIILDLLLDILISTAAEITNTQKRDLIITLYDELYATINATIQKIQYEYLEQNDEGNLNLEFNLKQFIQQIPQPLHHL